MKYIILASCFLLQNAFGAENKPTAEPLISRLQLKVDAMVMSADGLRIQDSGGTRSLLTFTAKRNLSPSFFTFGYRDFPKVNLSYQLKIAADNSMTLEVVEFEKMDYNEKTRTMNPAKEVRRENFTFKNFSQVSYVKRLDAYYNAVVRFTPDLSDDVPLKLTYPPMALGDAIVSDNANRVWAEGFGTSGEVSSFESPFGTLYVSFTEFSGSKEMGTAKDQVMTLKVTDRLTVRVRSVSSIVGPGIVAKVFGRFLPERKRSPSVSAMAASSVEKEIEEREK